MDTTVLLQTIVLTQSKNTSLAQGTQPLIWVDMVSPPSGAVKLDLNKDMDFSLIFEA